jgi:hypothetical protein
MWCRKSDVNENYTCKYCRYNLDGGDIFIMLGRQHQNLNTKELTLLANEYGWDVSSRMHFTREVHVYSGHQVLKVCPECNGVWPLDNYKQQEYYVRSINYANRNMCAL